jgi:major membrane immunogen (membrane-anchored lipoprotein)
MRRFYNTGLFAIVFISLFILGCATSKVAKVSPYIGEWHYTYQNMDGTDAGAVMTINEVEKVYKGVLSSQMG